MNELACCILTLRPLKSKWKSRSNNDGFGDRCSYIYRLRWEGPERGPGPSPGPSPVQRRTRPVARCFSRTASLRLCFPLLVRNKQSSKQTNKQTNQPAVVCFEGKGNKKGSCVRRIKRWRCHDRVMCVTILVRVDFPRFAVGFSFAGDDNWSEVTTVVLGCILHSFDTQSNATKRLRLEDARPVLIRPDPTSPLVYSRSPVYSLAHFYLIFSQFKLHTEHFNILTSLKTLLTSLNTFLAFSFIFKSL